MIAPRYGAAKRHTRLSTVRLSFMPATAAGSLPIMLWGLRVAWPERTGERPRNAAGRSASAQRPGQQERPHDPERGDGEHHRPAERVVDHDEEHDGHDHDDRDR